MSKEKAMYITPDFKRRIHVMGKPEVSSGYMLKVYDAETSEEILNIFRVELMLDAREMNVAKISYREHDAQGGMVVKDGEPVEGVVTVEHPSLALTAYEVDELPEE